MTKWLVWGLWPHLRNSEAGASPSWSCHLDVGSMWHQGVPAAPQSSVQRAGESPPTEYLVTPGVPHVHTQGTPVPPHGNVLQPPTLGLGGHKRDPRATMINLGSPNPVQAWGRIGEGQTEWSRKGALGEEGPRRPGSQSEGGHHQGRLGSERAFNFPRQLRGAGACPSPEIGGVWAPEWQRPPHHPPASPPPAEGARAPAGTDALSGVSRPFPGPARPL